VGLAAWIRDGVRMRSRASSPPSLDELLETVAMIETARGGVIASASARDAFSADRYENTYFAAMVDSAKPHAEQAQSNC